MRTVLERARFGKQDRVQQILASFRKAESEEATRDRRSAERTPFVRPVLITLGRDKHTVIHATSNNLSRTGIGLIHDIELRVGRMGVLTIYRLHEDPLQIRADVRWCQPFCGTWFASGWRFIVEERN